MVQVQQLISLNKCNKCDATEVRDSVEERETFTGILLNKK